MKDLEIKKFKDPVLKKKCEEVKEITSEIKKLVFDMGEAMKKNNGIGLAAPQIGVSKRVIVVQPDIENPRILALINPKVIKKSKEKDFLEEGCLSFPKIFLNISRPKEVEIEALNIKGDKVNFTAEGILSHVFQHEIDHLDGILFFDRLSFGKRIKFKLKNPWSW